MPQSLADIESKTTAEDGIPIHGVYIPADEARDAVFFTACMTKMQEALVYFLADQAMKIETLNRAAIAAEKRKNRLMQAPASSEHDGGRRRGALDAGHGGLNFEVLRSPTLSAFVFTCTASGLAPNPRLTQWIETYSTNLGFFDQSDSTAMTYFKKLMKMQNRYFQNPDSAPALGGDSVIFLRQAHKDRPILEKWLKAKADEYAPIKAIRLEKEGKELQYRVNNHKKFVNYVYTMASNFLSGLEKLYRHEGSINDDDRDNFLHETQATTFSVRVLLTRYLELRDALSRDELLNSLPIGAQIENPKILDEAWLLDTSIAHRDEETLFRFDHIPSEEEMLDRGHVLRWDIKRFDDNGKPLNTTRKDLQPRAGQVMYAMWILHCSSCTLPTNVCRFPGCNKIRSEALADLNEKADKDRFFENSIGDSESEDSSVRTSTNPQGTETSAVVSPSHMINFDNDDNGSDLFSNTSITARRITLEMEMYTHPIAAHMCGTGVHPLELRIKAYLVENLEVQKRHLPVVSIEAEGISPAAEIESEMRRDEEERSQLVQAQYLKVTHKDMTAEGRHLRYVHRRLLQSEKEVKLVSK